MSIFKCDDLHHFIFRIFLFSELEMAVPRSCLKILDLITANIPFFNIEKVSTLKNGGHSQSWVAIFGQHPV